MTHCLRFALVLVWSFVSFVGVASAVPVTVPNFSFESPAQGSGGVGGGSPTSWTLAGSGGVYRPNSDFSSTNPLPAPADGNQYAFLEAPTSGASASVTSGVLGTVDANTIYTLTAAIGNRNNAVRMADDYLIELLVDGSPVASNTLLDGYSNIPAGTFVDLVAGYQSSVAGGDLSIRLTHSSNDATFRQGAFDNIRLDALQVPEPPSLAIWGLFGLVGCCGTTVWRKRKSLRV